MEKTIKTYLTRYLAPSRPSIPMLCRATSGTELLLGDSDKWGWNLERETWWEKNFRKKRKSRTKRWKRKKKKS